MKATTVYELSNGQRYDTLKEAKRKCEAIYATELSYLAAKVVEQKKHTDVMIFLDANLERFIALRALKNDIELIIDNE